MSRNRYRLIIPIVCIIFISISFFSCSVAKEYKNIGDVINLENCEITIQKIEKFDIMEYVSPEEGNVFIAIKFDYKNITDSALEYKSLPTIDLQTSDKKSYTINYDASNIYAIIEGVDYAIMQDSLDSQVLRDDCEVYEVPASDLESKEIEVKITGTNKYIKVDFSSGADEDTENTDTDTEQ